MFFLNPITDTTKEFNFDLQIYLSKSKNNNSESKLNLRQLMFLAEVIIGILQGFLLCTTE